MPTWRWQRLEILTATPSGACGVHCGEALFVSIRVDSSSWAMEDPQKQLLCCFGCCITQACRHVSHLPPTVPHATLLPHQSRGFITLSASLGQMLVALHRALLHSIQQEHDPMVLAAALRALGTLLLGAPYHRLPPQLLPLCVAALRSCLAKATPPGGPATLAAEQAPVASACLSCLAAAFSSKAAEAVLSDQLLPSAGEGEAAAVGTAGGEQREQLLQLLFAYAACQLPALQLEAVLALRGVAQQHAVLLQGCWERLLALGRAGAALPAPAVPQSPRAQAGECRGQ